MSLGKRLVQIGTLVVLVGFFLPVMLVSCSGITTMKQSFSLADLAGKANQPMLYLLLVGAAVAGGVTFLKAATPRMETTYLWIQLGAMAAGTLSVILSLLSLSSQLNQGTAGMLQVQPDYGVLILAAGLVVFGIGWWHEWNGSRTAAADQPLWKPIENMNYPPPAIMEDQPGPRAPTSSQAQTLKTDSFQQAYPPRAGAWLEDQTPGAPVHEIDISCDDFTIGRSADNHLRLTDSTVSRHHAHLRFAEGNWFIQDTGSTGGTYVNGRKVPAIRLNSGDEITIGNCRFRFHLGQGREDDQW